MDNNQRKQTETPADLAKKNIAQDKRMDAIEAENREMKKRIDELEKHMAGVWQLFLSCSRNQTFVF